MRNWFWLLISLALSASAAAQAAAAGARRDRVRAEAQRQHHGRGGRTCSSRPTAATSSPRRWKGKGIYALLGRAKRTSEGTLGAERPAAQRIRGRAQRPRHPARVVRLEGQYHYAPLQRPDEHRAGAAPTRRTGFPSCSPSRFASRNGQPVSFHVADGRGMSRHTYEPAGRERVGTPAGEFDCLKVMRRNELGRCRGDLACGEPQLPAGAPRGGREGRHALRAHRDAHLAVRVTRALLAHAGGAASSSCAATRRPTSCCRATSASIATSGQNDRAFVAETVFAVLRRKRSLEAAAGSSAPQALVAAALLRVLGHSARALQGLVEEDALAQVRQQRRRRPAAGSARRPARLAVGAACAAARRRGGAAHRAGAAQPGAARSARQPRAHRARRRRRRSWRPTASSEGDAVFARRAAPRRQAGDQPPRAFTAGAGRSAGRGQPAAGVAARAAPRRDDRATTAPAPAARRSRRDADARHRARLRDGRLGQAPRRAGAARGARRHHQRAHAGARAKTTRARAGSPASSTACWSMRRAAASARCGAIPT